MAVCSWFLKFIYIITTKNKNEVENQPIKNIFVNSLHIWKDLSTNS